MRSPGVFREYWKQPEATAAAFEDGWFRTGDEAVVEHGYYRILGRQSVDILKSGGYKISALEIEAALRGHPSVVDCAVVGLADEEWGERVCAAVVPASRRTGGGESGTWLDEPQATWLAEQLSAWLKERLADYKVPRAWEVVSELPCTPLGKIAKPAVRRLFEEKRT